MERDRHFHCSSLVISTHCNVKLDCHVWKHAATVIMINFRHWYISGVCVCVNVFRCVPRLGSQAKENRGQTWLLPPLSKDSPASENDGDREGDKVHERDSLRQTHLRCRLIKIVPALHRAAAQCLRLDCDLADKWFRRLRWGFTIQTADLTQRQGRGSGRQRC